ncbi:hypothetical protein [Ferruginibacter sp.]|nr:hypothetical protein [Ferruginibacter sp.]
MSDQTITIVTGIKTRENIDEEPYGYIVEWMEWDSDFRNSTLQHADIIVGVNGKMYLKENREIDNPKAIGNYLESAWWEELRSIDGQTIILQVIRDGQPLSVSGKLMQQQFYLNAENRATIGLNGPVRMSNDGFSSAWGGWYEKFVRHASLYLDDKRWERSAINNRNILLEYQEWKPRIDFLVKKYPGRFADAVLIDWEKVTEILNGVSYSDITEADLEYRKIGEQRALLIKEAAIKGRDNLINEVAAQMIPAFPAMDAVHGNVLQVVGKLITLPVITFNQFINDLGKSYAVIGSAKEGYYFIHLNSKEMDIFFKTLFHYQAQVTPDIAERYQFFAEILNEPTILTYEGRAVTGLMVKVIAGMAGDDNLFIKITQQDKNGRVVFEGEETLSIFSGYTLYTSASPKQVIEAMIYYIKMGDKTNWQKLFCNWQVFPRWDGPPFIDMTYYFTEESYQHAWEQSRRQILNDIYDARVLFYGPVKTIIEENKKTGVTKVEQVKIIVDHIGKIEGNYKSISNLYVHRKWLLQRLNGGPWKITELQAL